MDAKPVRGFKIHDENVLPVAQQHKTLHSRNKSSPALSTLATKGALKMAAKRSAFGDIAITTRGNRPVTEQFAAGNGVKVQLDKKQAPLQQPAQKPLSILNGTTAQTSIETDHNSQVRKVLSKRATTIFKDYSTLPQDITTNENQARKSESIMLSLNTVNPDQENIPRKVATEKVDPYPRSHSTLLAGFKDLHIPAPLVNDAAPAVRQPEPVLAPEKEIKVVEKPSQSETRAAEVRLLAIIQNNANQASAVQQDYPPTKVLKSSDYSVPEPYVMVDEDYDDNYEDDGYVTARSFRSKHDNITEGNLTTILVPKTSRDIQRELEAASAVTDLMKSPKDIVEEEGDITMVAEYKEEIFEYYRELETRLAPNPHYMDMQTEIQWSMRSVLVDWVVQVHDRFQLLPETLFLTVNIIDRFLSIKIVSMNKLQLVGATALFVASKYEEVNCPTLKEMVFMVDNTYDEEEILKAERFMLTLLGFDLGWPGPMSFLRRISTADDYDIEARTMAKYFLELTIMDERFLECPPSFVSAGAHCLARLMLSKGHWSSAHVHYSGYTYSQIYPVILSILDCLEDPIGHHNAIYDKYCANKFGNCATFVRSRMRLGFRLMNSKTNTENNYNYLNECNALGAYMYQQVPGYFDRDPQGHAYTDGIGGYYFHQQSPTC